MDKSRYWNNELHGLVQTAQSFGLSRLVLCLNSKKTHEIIFLQIVYKLHLEVVWNGIPIRFQIISSGLLRHNTAHNGDIKSKASEAHQCGCAESKLHHWVCLAWRGSCHDSTTVWRGRWWNSIFHGATHADSSVMSGHTNPIRLSAQSVLKTWFESERSLKDPLAFSHLLNVGWILAVWIKGDETVFFKLALFLFPLNSLLRLSTESKK